MITSLFTSNNNKSRFFKKNNPKVISQHRLSSHQVAEIDHEANKLLQLTLLKEGNEGEIAYIKAGRMATLRLNEMGLVPKTRIKMLRKGILKGPVEILVRNSRLAIGAGLASKIYVKTR